MLVDLLFPGGIKSSYHLGWGGLFVFITCLFISLFVFFKDPKRILNRVWAIFAFSVSIFGLGFFMVDLSAGAKTAFFWWQFMYVGVIFIAVLYLHFALIFLDIPDRKILYVLYPVSVFFLAFNLFSRLYFRSVTWKFDSIWYADAGPLFIYFFLQWWGSILYAMYLLYKHVRISSGLKRNQIKYWWSAGIVGFFGGIFCYLPIFNINIVYPYSIYLIATWPIIVTFAIVKYRLWEIDTVIHKTALWILISVSIFTPMILFVYFARPVLTRMNALILSVFMTGLFFVFRYYYGFVQPKINHIFRRRKYDYSQILGMLSLSLKGVLDIRKLSQEVASSLEEALYPRKMGIILRDIKTGRFIPFRMDNFSSDLLYVSPQDKVIEYFRSNTHIEPKLAESDPDLSYLGESRFYRFLKEEDIPLVLSLRFEEDFIGFLVLGRKQTLQSYTFEDIQILENISVDISLYFYNALHHHDILEKQRLEDELNLGRQIQTSLLPAKSPEVKGASLKGFMHPAREIGGDYYDFFSYSPQRVGIVVADVSGKGLDAGMVMSMTKSALHTLSKQNLKPQDLVRQLNKVLCEQLQQQKFISLLYAEYDADNNVFTWAGAGQEHILVSRKSGVEVIKTGGIILGMFDEVDDKITQQSLTLEKGDRIVLYTDGATEARNAQNDMFTFRRLVQTVESAQDTVSVEGVLTHIQKQIQQFIQDAPQYDDITLVVLGRE